MTVERNSDEAGCTGPKHARGFGTRNMWSGGGGFGLEITAVVGGVGCYNGCVRDGRRGSVRMGTKCCRW